MTRKKKRRRSPPAAAAPAPAPEPPKPPRDWAEIGRAYGLLLLSAILMFLGFAGFGVWPLAFVGMVPALWVMDQSQAKGWVFFRRALFFGYVAWYGGFYWVVDTIVDFESLAKTRGITLEIKRSPGAGHPFFRSSSTPE